MRCEYALCQRPAEHSVLTIRDADGAETTVNACGLHVTPITSWGAVLSRVEVRPLAPA